MISYFESLSENLFDIEIFSNDFCTDCLSQVVACKVILVPALNLNLKKLHLAIAIINWCPQASKFYSIELIQPAEFKQLSLQN